MHLSVNSISHGVTSEDIQKARRSAKRSRVGVACARCKSLKIKCSNYRPCKHCLDASKPMSCEGTDPDAESKVSQVRTKKTCPVVKLDLDVGGSGNLQFLLDRQFLKNDGQDLLIRTASSTFISLEKRFRGWRMHEHVTLPFTASQSSMPLHSGTFPIITNIPPLPPIALPELIQGGDCSGNSVGQCRAVWRQPSNP